MQAAVQIPAPEIAKLPVALRAIAGASGRSAREILRGEAGIILKAWAGRTEVATQAQTDQRSHLQVLRKSGLDLTGSSGTQPGDITVNVGLRGPEGRVWIRSPRERRGTGRPFQLAGTMRFASGTFRPSRYHQRNTIWRDVTETVADVRYQMAKIIPAGRRTIGLARQSIVQIADHLGIALESVRGGGTLSVAGIAKARAALARTGSRYQNGTAAEVRQQSGYFLKLINRYPRAMRAGMDVTLQGVLVGRVRYFEQNLARGVFNSMRQTAHAYPYLRVEETS